MVDRWKKSWGMFKNEMKAKRCKTGDGGAKKNEKGNIPERPELVVQRLSSEVSGKAEKYTRVGPRKFVQYDEEELSIVGIKAPCEKHFSPSLEHKRFFCDVLAGEQGPSCHSMKHIPDLKVIHVRFIKSHRVHQHIFFNYKLYLLREKRPDNILQVKWINIQYRNWFIWLGKLPKLHHMQNGQTLGN